MNVPRNIAFAAACAVVVTLAACASPPPPRVVYAEAPPPARHPAYQHAISNLQAAQDFVSRRRPEDGRASRDEQLVLDELGAAIGDLQRADAVDGKRGPPPPPDTGRLPEGRMRAALALMRRAQADINREEDNPRARRFQQDALGHVNAAIGAGNDVIDR